MHRFGRSAQQKMKDRWGGGFILATILALFAAWYAGQWLGDNWGGNNTAGGSSIFGRTDNSPASTSSVEPKQFDMYFVQVGVFTSPANARGVVNHLHMAGYAPVMGPEANKFTPVFVGPYMDKQSAEDAKAKLEVARPDYKGAFTKLVSVGYNPSAVPVAAMGADDSDLKASLDTLNMYIQEVAIWMEDRSLNGTADTAGIESHGKALGELSATLSTSKDAGVKQFADAAAAASANATNLVAVAAKDANTPEFQAAMVEYMSLINQYRGLQIAK
ncbi:MAG TPA: SPOR domain-containing protein [Symbiobacteriaceae bacterium]|nr:SPOR domain-containing protein [Symbiobacteriaceae bacterium]